MQILRKGISNVKNTLQKNRSLGEPQLRFAYLVPCYNSILGFGRMKLRLSRFEGRLGRNLALPFPRTPILSCDITLAGFLRLAVGMHAMTTSVRESCNE